MVQKRQLAEEEYNVSPKHLKLESSCELVPFLQFTKEHSSLLSDKDDACFFKPIIEVDYGFVSDKFTDLPMSTTKDDNFTLSNRLSTSSLFSSTTSEEDLKSEPPLHTHDYKPRNSYSYFLEHPPLKKVQIGPQFQADIPELHVHKVHNNDDDIKFMGFSVISMHEDSTIQPYNDTIGKGRTDCHCKNHGSHNCIQLHINEARETLKGKIGNTKFKELGFGNMGESVASKWTEDDQQLFHEVVYANPVSFGQNFWNHLFEMFPSRTNQEIVSYYFNVFVLRKRAEQNRHDPMNVDSDDDEWQGSDESAETDAVRKYDSGEHRNGIEDSGTDHWNGNREFIYDRVWDIGYFSCSRTNKSDFLPTGSMIEEVFGFESWDFEVADDNKRSN